MRKYRIPVREYFLLDMNPVVRFLILSDFVFLGGLGLLAPVFALFVEKSIVDGSAAVVGIASSIYLVTKSIVQIPAASIVDQIRGEHDDFWFLFISSFCVSLIPLAYLFISNPLELYVVQFIYGAAAAFAFPTYMALFTRHADRDKEGTEWGIYFTFTNMSAAFAAFIGGTLVEIVGFDALIILMVIVTFFGALLTYPIKSHIFHIPVHRSEQIEPTVVKTLVAETKQDPEK